MHVVGAHKLYVVLACQFHQSLVYLYLKGISLAVSPLVGIFHLMPLQFQIEVVSKQVLKPESGLFRFLHITFSYGVGNFPRQTCGACYQSLMIFLNILMVCSRPAVESVGPCTAHELHKIVVAFLVFRKQNKVPST